jgi:hypothetical protein
MHFAPGVDIDRIMLVKALRASPGFELLQERFDAERKRMLDRLLHPNCPDEETLRLKFALTAMDTVSPKHIAETLLRSEMGRIRRDTPELLRTTPATG